MMAPLTPQTKRLTNEQKLRIIEGSKTLLKKKLKKIQNRPESQIASLFSNSY